jgi:hypothetical protein
MARNQQATLAAFLATKEILCFLTVAKDAILDEMHNKPFAKEHVKRAG